MSNTRPLNKIDWWRTLLKWTSFLWCHYKIFVAYRSESFFNFTRLPERCKIDRKKSRSRHQFTLFSSNFTYIFSVIYYYKKEINRMMSFIKTAAFAALTLLASSTNAHSDDHSHGGYESGLPCTPCDDFEGDCLVTVKVNFFAGTTGRYWL